MIGASIYSYRNNFKGNTPAKRPKKKSIKVKLIDVLRPGYRLVSRYEDDLFIQICQWLMVLGYPGNLTVRDYNSPEIDKFLSDALFNINPFHAEYLFVNSPSRFHLFEWREKFDLFSETHIKGLDYYRNRASMPIEQFKSFYDIKRILFTNKGEHNEIVDKLGFSPNSCHPDAIWILSKGITVLKDKFRYFITYGTSKKDSSSWHISIMSEEKENYVDFCLRLYSNYSGILSGESIKQDGEYSQYYKLITEY